MKNIQKFMREHKFEDAVGMFRAARFVSLCALSIKLDSNDFRKLKGSLSKIRSYKTG